jgi:hypothetical protein
MKMWRKPVVNLMGVMFTVYDSHLVDVHRADGSIFEVSDASISYALLADKKISVNDPVEFTDAHGKNISLRPSELRAALGVYVTKDEVQKQIMFLEKANKRYNPGEQQTRLLPTLGMLKYSTSKGGGEQMIRDLGRPGLGGCRATLEELQEMKVWQAAGSVLNLEAKVEGVVKQTGNEMFAKPVIMYKIRCVCERVVAVAGGGVGENSSSGSGGEKVVREEWVCMRRYNDFVSLHKNLKAQLTENNPRTKELSVHEAGGKGNRMLLLPTLPPKKNLNVAVGMGGSKFLEQRGRGLNVYLKYMLDRHHVLSGCSELKNFLSAVDEIKINIGGATEDEFGRSERSRTVVVFNGLGVGGANATNHRNPHYGSPLRSVSSASEGDESNTGKDEDGDDDNDDDDDDYDDDISGQNDRSDYEEEGGGDVMDSSDGNGRRKPAKKKKSKKKKEALDHGGGEHHVAGGGGAHSKQVSARAMAFEAAMNASIHQRLNMVSSREVQEGIFDLCKELLSLDKANFLRGRMISVIRGVVNFMTGGSTLHKTLYNLHLKHVTGNNIGGGVKWLRELLWPEGEWGEAAPELTSLEKEELAKKVFESLPKYVPEALSSVVGVDLAGEGINLVFDLLQNETILKSISYQLIDAIILELYPELQIDLDGLHAVED